MQILAQEAETRSLTLQLTERDWETLVWVQAHREPGWLAAWLQSQWHILARQVSVATDQDLARKLKQASPADRRAIEQILTKGGR